MTHRNVDNEKICSRADGFDVFQALSGVCYDQNTTTKSKEPAEHRTPYDSSSAPVVFPSCRQDWTITSPAGTCLSTHKATQTSANLGYDVPSSATPWRDSVSGLAPCSLLLLHDCFNHTLASKCACANGHESPHRYKHNDPTMKKSNRRIRGKTLSVLARVGSRPRSSCVQGKCPLHR